MPEFCTKCGKKLEPGTSFCTSCGNSTTEEIEPLEEPVVASEPILTPPPKKGSGCGAGCLIGCLIVLIVFIVLIAILFGIFYYYLFMREVRPGSYFDVDDNQPKTVNCDTFSCLDNNLKDCKPAKGEAELGDFATADIEILGTSGSECIVFAEITEINELPSGLDSVPEFIIEKILNSATLECSVPKKVYSQGMEELGEYIGDNMYEACDGPLFDMAEKFGVDLEY